MRGEHAVVSGEVASTKVLGERHCVGPICFSRKILIFHHFQVFQNPYLRAPFLPWRLQTLPSFSLPLPSLLGAFPCHKVIGLAVGSPKRLPLGSPSGTSSFPYILVAAFWYGFPMVVHACIILVFLSCNFSF